MKTTLLLFLDTCMVCQQWVVISQAGFVVRTCRDGAKPGTEPCMWCTFSATEVSLNDQKLANV